MSRNLQIVLDRRPTTLPIEQDFVEREGEIPEAGPGQVLVRTLIVSIEPAMRGWILDAPNYLPPVPVGSPMRSFGVGEVVTSNLEGFRAGDLVVGFTGWQEWATMNEPEIQRRIDPDLAPISTSLGVLGVTGLTAYVGMIDIGRPGPGSTVLVTSAAGAVGSAAGQLAALRGARVVGLTGSGDKCRQCIEYFGFDAAINYREEDDLAEAIRRECPDGVDVFFDSVGGATFDAALENLNVGARVAICGTISLPPDGKAVGPRIERRILVKRISIQGFLATDHFDRFDQIIAEMSVWLRNRKVRHLEEMAPSLTDAPAALVRLLEGRNMGKSLVRVSDRYQKDLS
ncbi:NADP-dependent oxidoreductase [Rhodococcus koreensis]|uniref:NADP-dependent oxidoreductase n=1 Tax=Rhodococcus koreensis TaxID=99653 RepID=UPI00197CEDD8|nr:NADP-dependent oxidoreductase [Rhodococcus koreensis]QSE86775.1 NADP-dependent oxidoreductase [Rhodococcus koreensis]